MHQLIIMTHLVTTHRNLPYLAIIITENVQVDFDPKYPKESKQPG